MTKNVTLSAIIMMALLIGTNLTAIAQKKKSRDKDVPPMTMVEIITDSGTIKIHLFDQTPQHRDNFLKLASQGFYDSLLFHRVIPNFMVQGGDPESKNAIPGKMLGNGDVGYTIPAEFNDSLFHKKGALCAARTENPEKASSGCQFYLVQGKKSTDAELTQLEERINMQRRQGAMTKLFTDKPDLKNKFFEVKKSNQPDSIALFNKNVLEPELAKSIKPFKYSDAQRTIYKTIGGTPHLDQGYTVFGEVIEGLDVIDKIAAVKTGSGDRPLVDVRMKVRVIETMK
ncbi:MAG: peptidylprolyl isomerase [Bacteroidota bacterium]